MRDFTPILIKPGDERNKSLGKMASLRIFSAHDSSIKAAPNDGEHIADRQRDEHFRSYFSDELAFEKAMS